jgi:hypothetical protein
LENALVFRVARFEKASERARVPDEVPLPPGVPLRVVLLSWREAADVMPAMKPTSTMQTPDRISNLSAFGPHLQRPQRMRGPRRFTMQVYGEATRENRAPAPIGG